MPQFLRNCGRGDIRGRPAGRLSFFLGCARGATGLDFALCGGRGGALPLHPASLLEKGWTENLFGSFVGVLLEHDLPMLLGGIVNALHDLRGQHRIINM